MMNLRTLIDVTPDWMTNGIFTDLNNFGVPWKSLNISNDLNIAYYGQHSGDKIISPFVEKFLTDGELTATNRKNIASAIYTVCGQNWTKLFATLNQEYELLDNTNAHTEETTTTEGTRDTTDSGTNTGTINHGISGTDTKKNKGTVKTDGTTGTDRTVNNDIYGFNSESASNADKQTGTDNTTVNQTETNDLTEELTRGTTDLETRDLADSRTGNETTKSTITHTIHRYGNIGVTTSQQMLNEERDLWKWYFYNYVFEDIDKMLTIGIY